MKQSVIVAAAVLALSISRPAAAQEDLVRVDPILAVVGGSTVPLSTVESMAAVALRQVRDQEYAVRRQALEDVIFQVLVAREAQARGVTAEELSRQEVDAKVSVPSDTEKRAFYGQNAARMGSRTYEETESSIGDHLRQVKAAQRRSTFLRALKAKYGMTLFLEPPRAVVNPSDDPSRGPKDAPVTVVVFSDFQCPHCSKAVELEDRLLKLYGDSVRLVFRDYPLSAHKDAPRAAESGACAADQGKFWAYHDVLFAHQKDLSDAGLKAAAAKAGLNAKAFAACLASGKHAEEWKADVADGQKSGVSGTPTFFVNGRMFFGTPPFETLVQAVDDEFLLRRLPLPGAEKIKSVKPPKQGKKAG